MGSVDKPTSNSFYGIYIYIYIYSNGCGFIAKRSRLFTFCQRAFLPNETTNGKMDSFIRFRWPMDLCIPVGSLQHCPSNLLS
jgi:hypothetical protein